MKTRLSTLRTNIGATPLYLYSVKVGDPKLGNLVAGLINWKFYEDAAT
jgi:hypothetical protein